MLRYTQPLIPLLAVAAVVAWAAIPRPAWRTLVAAPALAQENACKKQIAAAKTQQNAGQ